MGLFPGIAGIKSIRTANSCRSIPSSTTTTGTSYQYPQLQVYSGHQVG